MSTHNMILAASLVAFLPLALLIISGPAICAYRCALRQDWTGCLAMVGLTCAALYGALYVIVGGQE